MPEGSPGGPCVPPGAQLEPAVFVGHLLCAGDTCSLRATPAPLPGATDHGMQGLPSARGLCSRQMVGALSPWGASWAVPAWEAGGCG